MHTHIFIVENFVFVWLPSQKWSALKGMDGDYYWLSRRRNIPITDLLSTPRDVPVVQA